MIEGETALICKTSCFILDGEPIKKFVHQVTKAFNLYFANQYHQQSKVYIESAECPTCLTKLRWRIQRTLLKSKGVVTIYMQLWLVLLSWLRTINETKRIS